MNRWLLVLTIALGFLASPAWAQRTLERSPTTRGMVRDTSTILAARDAADRAGADCRVTEAALRGIDTAGDRHYEIACRDGPGYLIVAGTRDIAYDCLMLESQNARLAREGRSERSSPVCTLRSNQNPTRHLASMAARAGMDCRVDGGRVVGISPDQNPIYEIGCRGTAGAWIERAAEGWAVTNCIEVRSRGDVCQFTSETEELLGFRQRLAGSAAQACAPTQLRAMGRNAVGLSYFEVTCGRGESLVVGLDEAHQVTNILSCAEAAHIGSGCWTEARRPDR